MNTYTIEPKGKQPTVANLSKKAKSRINTGCACVEYIINNDGKTLFEDYGKEAAENLAATLINRYLVKTQSVKRITRAPWYEMGGSIITVKMSDGTECVYFFKD